MSGMAKVSDAFLTGPGSSQSKELIREYVDSIPLRAQDDDSEIVLGSGRFRYRLVNDWAKLPAGWSFRDVGAVAVDNQDRVYVFNRGTHPMIIFDREGNLLQHWGEELFVRA